MLYQITDVEFDFDDEDSQMQSVMTLSVIQLDTSGRQMMKTISLKR
jgi:hypothetical protein